MAYYKRQLEMENAFRAGRISEKFYAYEQYHLQKNWKRDMGYYYQTPSQGKRLTLPAIKP